MRLATAIALLVAGGIATTQVVASGEPPAPLGATSGTGRCGEVEATRYAVRGGCTVEVESKGHAYRLLTLFGNPEIATCDATFEMHVSDDGRIWISDIEAGKISGACNDIASCRKRLTGEDSYKSPRRVWTGRLRATGNGAYRADVDMCWDTCAGRFEGRTRLSLTPGPQTWSLRADDATLGPSGMALDGTWSFPRGDLELERG